MSTNLMHSNVSLSLAARSFYWRPRLDTQLKNAFKKPITLIVAGAGFGKTQSVLATLNSTLYSYSHMQLSALDNNTDRFWNRFSSLIAKENDELYNNLVSIGFPSSVVSYDYFFKLLNKEYVKKRRFIFIFDDLYFINNKTILNFIELFSTACTSNLSIIIISRSNPALNLTGMLSKGFMTKIVENDLRFTKKEIYDYFCRQGFVFSENTLDNLFFSTNGWIFAIYLIGLSAKKIGVEERNLIVNAQSDINELIDAEIFRKLSKELQSLLIKLAMLEDIPLEFLKKMTNYNIPLISEMLQISMFINQDSSSNCYRIHQLFKDFLIEKKESLSKEEVYDTYLFAANWYDSYGCKFKAINYYKKCNCFEQIFDIICSIKQHVSMEVANYFIHLINECPNEIIFKYPIMNIIKAKCLLNNNYVSEAKYELNKIRLKYEKLSITMSNQYILGETYIMLALLSMTNQDYEFVNFFKLADNCLPYGSKLIDSNLNIAEGLNICSIKNSHEGELDRYQYAIFDVAPYASKVMNGCSYGIENLCAAEFGLYVADLKKAETHAYKAIYKSQQYQQYDIEYMAYFVLVRVFIAKGNYYEVKNIFNRMEEKLKVIQNLTCFYIHEVIKGWLGVKIGNIQIIAEWLRYGEDTKKFFAPVYLGREYLVQSDCLLMEGRYLELLAFMEKTDKLYESRGILFAVIQNKITQAIVYHYMGDYLKSIESLYEAYKFSHPNNLIMQFIEYGSKMRSVIRSARLNKECKIPKEWLDNIYTKSSTYSKQLSQIISEYNIENKIENINAIKLSKRELEVLLYLSRGLTRDEIAESCFISLSTVNSTIRSIYNKLDASNIADAVRLAKEGGII